MEASEVMGSTPGFMLLLRQLADEHHREVGKLSAEVARLQRVCEEIGSNTSSEARRRVGLEGDPEHKTPLLSDPLGLLEKNSIPDEGALSAAFLVAKDADQRKEILGEERPDEDALASALDLAAFVEERDDTEDTLLSHEVDGFVPREEIIHRGLPPPSPHERELLLSKESQELTKRSIEVGRPVSKAHFGRSSPSYEEIEVFRDSICTKSLDSDGLQPDSFDTEQSFPSGSMRSQPSIKSSVPPGILYRWDIFIKAIKMKQAIASMPGLCDVWKQVAEDKTAAHRRGVIQLDMLVASAAKASKFQPGTGSQSLMTREPSEAKNRCNCTNPDSLFCRIWRKCMLHPTCRRRVCWDVAGIALLVHDLIFIPMQAFDQGTAGMPAAYENFLKVLDVFGASFWTLDITVSFRTGYYSAEGFVELRPWQVAQNYIKSWLPLDLIIVCADWGSMFLGMSSASGFMRLGKTVSRFMRVFRLLRFLKMNRAIKEIMERINSEYVLQVIGLMKTLVLIVIVNHYIACAWYGLGCIGLISRWPDKFLVNYPDSFAYAYTTALHWSLTQFTPASMEVVPQNSVERFFVIVVIILALVAFSSFVSSITAAMTHIRQINAQKLQLESKIRQFFSEHKISHAMASRVWHFLRKNRIGASKRMRERDIPAFKSLPGRIKEDLRLEIYSPILSVHPLFIEYGRRCDVAMIKICNEAIDEQSLVVGEELFRNVDDIKDMLFIAYGGLGYYEQIDDLDDELYVPTEVHHGQWALEAALWADKAALPGVFVTLPGGCEIVLLNAHKFQHITSNHVGDDALNFLAKYAQIFMDRFNASNADIHEQDGEYSDVEILFNLPERTTEFVAQADEEVGNGNRRSKAAEYWFNRSSRKSGAVGSLAGGRAGTSMMNFPLGGSSRFSGQTTISQETRQTSNG